MASFSVDSNLKKNMKNHLSALFMLPLMLVFPLKSMANGLLGDVNGDKVVNTTDVSDLVSYLLSKSDVPAGTPDVNLDGSIDVADVTALVNLVLHPSGKLTFVVNGELFTMVPVEGGTFNMGSNGSDVMDNEKPVHRVTLSTFYMAETEFTQKLYKAVMGKGHGSTYKGDNLPIHRITWDDCQKLIAKLNEQTGFTFRMPTEAEWEFAARGGTKSKGYKYAGSNTLANVAWYSANSGNKPNEVATKAPNELGIYDMSGNVKEWCSDFYAEYSSAAQTNPTGPEEDDVIFKSKVNRGGAFNSVESLCTVTTRSDLQQTNSSYVLGLRLALVP